MLADLRARRGLSKHRLSQLSGATEATIRRLEAAPGRGHGGTWQKIFETLAELGLFTPDEISKIAAETGLSPQVLIAINKRAEPRSQDDRRRTARSRIMAVVDAHDDRLDHLADMLEAAARAFGPRS